LGQISKKGLQFAPDKVVAAEPEVAAGIGKPWPQNGSSIGEPQPGTRENQLNKQPLRVSLAGKSPEFGGN
jgi:hypothetical protein